MFWRRMSSNINIIKRIISVPYAQIAHEIFLNPKLSFKAKGLLSWLLSKPDDWVFSISGILTQCSDGADSVRSGLRELIKEGYLFIERRRENGKYLPSIWHISQHSNNFSTTGFSTCGFSTTGFSPRGESGTSNNKEEIMNEDEKENSYVRTENSDELEPSKTFQEGKELAKYFFEKIRINNPKAKEPNLEKWAQELERLLRIDKRTPLEARELIDWALKDDFWKGNILSPEKLRKHWDQLTIKIKNPQSQKEELCKRNSVAASRFVKMPICRRAEISYTITNTYISNNYTKNEALFSLPSETFLDVLIKIFGLQGHLVLNEELKRELYG